MRRSNCDEAEREREIWVTRMREKCGVICGWVWGRWVFIVWRREVIWGSRVVFEEGRRMPRRMGWGGGVIVGVL